MAPTARDKLFGRRVRAAREAAGYASQEELARTLGVSVFTVSRWERGESKPDFDGLHRLADALRVSAASLLEVAA